MKILAFDSSSEVLSIALFDSEKKIADFEAPLFTRHSAMLAPSLDIILKSHGLRLKDIDCLVVGLGPGSFTGLRVGVTTAKVFAYALGKKLVGIPSFEAIACLGGDHWEGTLAVLLDAKKDKLYAALYESKKRKIKMIKKPFLTDIKSVLATSKKPALFLGSGALLHRERIAAALKGRHRINEEKQKLFPKAEALVKLALPLIERKKFSDPWRLEPLYLHPRDCNAIRKKLRPVF